MQKIRKTFELSGLAFLPNNGVSRSDEKIKVYEDAEGYLAFFDAVFEAVNERNAEVTINGSEELKFYDFAQKYNLAHHTKRMQDLYDADNSVKILCIVEEGKDIFPGISYANYRTVPSEIFPAITTYGFEDKVGIFLWGTPLKILVVQDKDMADAYRIQFYMHWEKGKPI